MPDLDRLKELLSKWAASYYAAPPPPTWKRTMYRGVEIAKPPCTLVDYYTVYELGGASAAYRTLTYMEPCDKTRYETIMKAVERTIELMRSGVKADKAAAMAARQYYTPNMAGTTVYAVYGRIVCRHNGICRRQVYRYKKIQINSVGDFARLVENIAKATIAAEALKKTRETVENKEENPLPT